MTATYKLQDFLSKWGWLLSLASVLLYALALRLINFIGVLDWDVIEYTHLVNDILHGNFEFRLIPRESGFRLALIYPLAFLYQILGVSEFSTILYPLVCSLFGVLAIYGISRLVANESAGLIAALVWASLPLHVFLSTFFGPDGILANLTVISVFFLLLGYERQERGAKLSYLLSFCFAVLAIFVKPSAAIFFVFLASFIAYRLVLGHRQTIQDRLSRLRPIVVKTVLIAGALLGSGTLLAYLHSQPLPFLLSLHRTAIDFSNLLVLGATQESLPGQFFLSTFTFLIFTPLFLVAAVGLLVQRNATVLPIYLWGATMFLYFEWGSLSLNLATYVPFFVSLNDRNVLFLVAPFVVLIGVFFSRWIEVNRARWLVALSLLVVIPVAWFQKSQDYSGQSEGLISLAVMAVLIGLLALPAFAGKKYACAYVPAVVLLALLAFLYPTPPLHLSSTYWQLQIGYRAATSEAAQFFAEHPGYPILTLDSRNGRELNWASRFELGFFNQPWQQDVRIHVHKDPTQLDQSSYLYFRDEISQFQPVPSHWWKMAEFDTGTNRPIIVYRVLSPEDAARELVAAKLALQDVSTPANLERLLAAAVNAKDAQAAIIAWFALAQADATAYPVELVSPTVLDAYQQSTLATSPDLLAGSPSFEYFADAEVSENISVNIAETGKSLFVYKDAAGNFSVYTRLPLNPNSVYIFVADIRSSVGVDLVAPLSHIISDSHGFDDIYGEGERKAVVFATGDWQGAMNLDFHLFRVQEVGFVELENPQLFQVKVDYAP